MSEKTNIQLEAEDTNGIAIYKSLLGGTPQNWIAEVHLENPARFGLGCGETMTEALQSAIDNAQ